MLDVVYSTAGVLEPGEVFLVSSMRALMDGRFDGTVTFQELMRHGDFGLGTFDALDGEMVACDGQYFQVTSDYRVRPVEPDQTTPFATVIRFEPTTAFALPGDFASVTAAIHDRLPSPGAIHAIRARGTFRSVHLRVVHRESKPYPSLADLRQVERTRQDLTGTIVGFNFPPDAEALAGPEYHLHFLSDDHTFAGHVMDFESDGLQVELAPSSRLRTTAAPTDIHPLSEEQSNAMHRVEGRR